MDFSFFREMSVAGKTLFFLGLVFIGFGLGAGVVGLVALGMLGMSPDEFRSFIAFPDPTRMESMKWMNNIVQLFGFVVPVWVFHRLFGSQPTAGLMLRPFSPFWLLAPLLIVAANGLIDFSGTVNEWFIPQGSMLYDLLKPQEDQAMRLTELMLNTPSGLSLVNTILAVALVPAVAEELTFRGVLQPLLARWTGNVHVAIWSSAFLFSFIHFQFFGFLPRLLLGGILGYLVWWSGSLWPAIWTHFANNLMAILIYRYLGIPNEDSPTDYVLLAISLVSTCFVIYYYHNWAKKRGTYSLYPGFSD